MVQHKIIGQVFDTYWIIEYEDRMYIVDQHAAHEKVMFESLMEKYRNKEINSQIINPPIILNLSMWVLKTRKVFCRLLNLG